MGKGQVWDGTGRGARQYKCSIMIIAFLNLPFIFSIMSHLNTV